MLNNDVSRRNFLKSTAALGTAAALVGCSKGDSGEPIIINGPGSGSTLPYEEEKLVPSVCRPNCFSACYLNAHVRNGRMVKTSRRNLPDPSYNRICLRGLSQLQRMYSPSRLTKPLMRDGERGSGKWKTVQWSEAIKYICDRFKEAQAIDKTSVVFMPGSSNYATVQKSVLSRFFNVMGATSIGQQLDICEAIGFARALGVQTSFPFNQSNEIADFRNAKTIIAWGANPAEAQIHNWHFIADAKENGAKLISIDVMLSGTAARADRVVHVYPGSDALLALSMIQVIIANNWIDKDFMGKNTVAPFLVNTATKRFVRYSELSTADKALVNNPPSAGKDSFIAYFNGNFEATNTTFQLGSPTPEKPYLAGKHVFRVAGQTGAVIYPNFLYTRTEGVPVNLGTIEVMTAFEMLKNHVDASYTPAMTESKTGVAANIVEDIAKIYTHEGPATLIAGYAPDHYTNGHHVYHALATLAAITGNMGKKGASVGSFVGLGGGAITGGNITTVPGYAAGPSIPYPIMADVFNVDDAPAPIVTPSGKNYGGPNELFLGNSVKQRAIYVAYGNPLNTYVNTSRLKKMFTKKEAGGDYKIKLIALADYELCDTAEYADVVLPLAHWFEQKDVCSASNHPYMTYQDIAVPPLGECKTNMEIAHLMAEEMGFGHLFRYSIEEYIEMVFDTPSFKTWYQNMTGTEPEQERVPTYSRLKAEDAIRVYPGKMNEPYIYPPYRTKTTTGADDLSIGTSFGVSSGTGRVEFYSDFIWAPIYYGQASGAMSPAGPFFFQPGDTGVDMAKEQLPSYEPPARSVPGNAEYPLQLMSERVRWRVHSQWHNTPWIRKFDPYPIIKINPSDAGTIKTGDLVRISNYNGFCYARAMLNPGIRKGTVNVPRGWHESQFREHYSKLALASDNGDAGGSQRLTTSEVHPVTGGQSFYDVIVKIMKVEG